MSCLLVALLVSQVPQFQPVRLIVTSDLHGRVRSSCDFDAPGEPRRRLGGWQGLLEAIESESDASTVLLDCGDFAFGSPEADSSHGRTQVDFMNRAGYAAAALGARDFTGGAANLEILAGQAEFRVLSDPMLDVVLNRRLPMFRPYAVKRVGMARIGLVGLADPRIPKANGTDDTRGFDPGDVVSQFRRYLPAVLAETADVLVCFGHVTTAEAGLLLDSFPQLDLVFCPEDGGEVRSGVVPVSSYGRRLAVVDLLYHVREQRPELSQVRHVNVQGSDGETLPPEPAGVVLPGMDPVVLFAGSENGVGERGQVSLASTVAEAVRQETGTDVVLLPVGAAEPGLPAGELTGRDLYRCVPFHTRLRWAMLDDTCLHRLFSVADPSELAPALAGAGYFVLADTTRWPLADQVARVRTAGHGKTCRVASTALIFERSGLGVESRPIERSLSELWLDWCGRRDTLEPVAPASLYRAAAGMLEEEAAPSRPININTATAALLERLPGIGPKTAERIIAYRAAHGRFNSVDALRNVKGIGPKKLAKLRPLVTVR